MENKLIYVKTNKNVIKLDNKEVKISQWTTKDEKAYLKLLEKEANELNDKKLFDILIAPCIEDKNLVLSPAEQKKIIIEIRKISIGKTFDDILTCEKCNHEEEYTIDLDEVVSYKESSWGTVIVDDIEITFGKIKDNNKKKALDIKKGIVEYVFTSFLLNIEKIKINGEDFTNISIKDLNAFIDSLPTIIFDLFFEKYQEMSDEIIINKKWQCTKCSEEQEKVYIDVPGLLWA